MTYRLLNLLNEFHLSYLDDEYFEKIFASTDELILFNMEIKKLDKPKIEKLVDEWRKSASDDDKKKWWWEVSVKSKIECRNIECDGSCLECNNVEINIDVQDNLITIEKIL
jgi:hypothetical protein